MSAIDAARYVGLVRQQADALEVPTGPPRRRNVRDVERVLQVTRNDLAWIDEAVAAGQHPVPTAAEAACGRAREVTSLLYAAGAQDQAWRHWASLSAFGLLLTTVGHEPCDDGHVGENTAEAVQYAVLAGEWRLAGALPHDPPRAEYYAESVVWALGVGETDLQPPAAAVGDDAADVWWSFFTAVAERNPGATTLALHTITEVHIDLFGDGWERFVEWDYPLFDPMAGAGAALARHHGLVTDDLSDLDRRYLDPGLAAGEPPPLYPEHWPEPSPVTPRSAAQPR
jgi:hypothetical protein